MESKKNVSRFPKINKDAIERVTTLLGKIPGCKALSNLREGKNVTNVQNEHEVSNKNKDNATVTENGYIVSEATPSEQHESSIYFNNSKYQMSEIKKEETLKDGNKDFKRTENGCFLAYSHVMRDKNIEKFSGGSNCALPLGVQKYRIAL